MEPFTANTLEAIKNARRILKELNQATETVISTNIKSSKRIHWYSRTFSKNDLYNVPKVHLNFSDKIPLAARINGDKWYSFPCSRNGNMSGREFKKAIADFGRTINAVMIEVEPLSDVEKKNRVIFIEQQKESVRNGKV